MKALLLENVHPVGEAALRDAGFSVERVDASLKEDEVVKRDARVHLLGIRSKTRVTERVLAAGRDVISIGAYCIGTNQIALAAAMKRGVCVFNAPFSNT